MCSNAYSVIKNKFIALSVAVAMLNVINLTLSVVITLRVATMVYRKLIFLQMFI